MGFVVAGPSTKILVDQFDLSRFFNSVSLPLEVNTADTTGFGKTAHCYTPLMTDGSLSLGGFFDGAADAADEEIGGALAGAAKTVTVALAGMEVGNPVRMLSSLTTSYEVSGEVDGVVEISAEAVPATKGVEVGRSLRDLVALATGGVASTGAPVDNGVATTNGGVGHLHATVVAGTDLITWVQHSVDGAVWVDLFVFTTATSATSQRFEVLGTINRYLRSVYITNGGSATASVAFARR